MGKNTGTKSGRSEAMLLRVPPTLKDAIRNLAEAEGMNMTTWAHRALDRAVQEDAAERRHQEVMAELRNIRGLKQVREEMRLVGAGMAAWDEGMAEARAAARAQVQAYGSTPPRKPPGSA